MIKIAVSLTSFVAFLQYHGKKTVTSLPVSRLLKCLVEAKWQIIFGNVDKLLIKMVDTMYISNV
jgi:hypothetical protein